MSAICEYMLTSDAIVSTDGGAPRFHPANTLFTSDLPPGKTWRPVNSNAWAAWTAMQHRGPYAFEIPEPYKSKLRGETPAARQTALIPPDAGRPIGNAVLCGGDAAIWLGFSGLRTVDGAGFDHSEGPAIIGKVFDTPRVVVAVEIDVASDTKFKGRARIEASNDEFSHQRDVIAEDPQRTFFRGQSITITVERLAQYTGYRVVIDGDRPMGISGVKFFEVV